MIQYMLDTDICIYIIRRKPADVIKRLMKSRISQIGISSITLSELDYGVEKSSKQEQNQVALAQFLAPMEILSYGDEAAQQHGRTTLFRGPALSQVPATLCKACSFRPRPRQLAGGSGALVRCSSRPPVVEADVVP
jgi:hypothetical protein